MDTLVSNDIIAFGDFRLDRRGHRLLRRNEDGELAAVPLGSRAVEILRVLVERASELVSRQEIMHAVWPGTAVEEGNLTVQLSALRRVLDAGRTGGSCIQTVPGRGYRFVEPVLSLGRDFGSAEPADQHAEPLAPVESSWGSSKPRRAIAVGLFLVAVVLLAGTAGRLGWWSDSWVPPRWSIVVLPFENLSGEAKDDALAQGITDDLTSDLARNGLAKVAAPATVRAYKPSPRDLRAIGQALNVRYAVEGIVRRLGETARVNVHLVSTETGVDLWADRFDETVPDDAAAAGAVAEQMRDMLNIRITEIENARSLRERPDDPDVLDLLIRVRALEQMPIAKQREKQILALCERALTLDPTNVAFLVCAAYYTTDLLLYDWGSYTLLERTEQRFARALEIEPTRFATLDAYLFFLRTRRRCSQAVELIQQIMRTDPDDYRQHGGLYNNLASCRLIMGHADEMVALQEKGIALNPHEQMLFNRYRKMGFASALLGRDADAVRYLEKSLSLNPEQPYGGSTLRWLAACYALLGRIEEARRAAAESLRLDPYQTVHTLEYWLNPIYDEPVRRIQDALRLAGMRDHADEDADFGLATDRVLHDVYEGPTPKAAPGVATIRTADLPRLLADAMPLVIDAATHWWGKSIPGAIALPKAGLGGDFDDGLQDKLRPKMRELTGADLTRPIVAVGFNSERFDGRNLALRLVALGYTHVYWYRGGREAWEVAGLPEAPVDVQDW